MDVRELTGQGYRAFEWKVRAHKPTHKVLRRIAKHLEEHCPHHLVSSITMCCDPYDEDYFLYTVVVYR